MRVGPTCSGRHRAIYRLPSHRAGRQQHVSQSLWLLGQHRYSLNECARQRGWWRNRAHRGVPRDAVTRGLPSPLQSRAISVAPLRDPRAATLVMLPWAMSAAAASWKDSHASPSNALCHPTPHLRRRLTGLRRSRAADWGVPAAAEAGHVRSRSAFGRPAVCERDLALFTADTAARATTLPRWRSSTASFTPRSGRGPTRHRGSVAASLPAHRIARAELVRSRTPVPTPGGERLRERRSRGIGPIEGHDADPCRHGTVFVRLMVRPTSRLRD
jgi:hypothetical protein